MRSGPAIPAPRLPRPNPGPEPWPDPVAGPGKLAGAGLSAAALLALIFLAVRRRVRRARRPGSNGTTGRATVGSSPRDRLIERSEAVRRRLVERFGTAYLARTTEEIGADADLAAALGGEAVAALARLLRAADRAKFDPSPGPESYGEGPDDPRVAAFLDEPSSAGASSTIRGR